MRNIIILLTILSFIGCGTKKRVINIERGLEIAKEDRNIVSEETSSSFDIDTSKIKIKTAEQTYGSVVEKWVWGENGEPVSYTKTAISKGNVITETEELKGAVSEMSSTSKIVDQSVLTDEKNSESIQDNLDRENPPPVFFKGWWWVMVIAGVITLSVMWLFARR